MHPAGRAWRGARGFLQGLLAGGDRRHGPLPVPDAALLEVGVGVWGWVGIDVYLTTEVRIGGWLVAQLLEGLFSAESKQIFANY